MNRVIKDSIWTSPSLAKLPLLDQLHWPRWLLQGDDWGCFEAGAGIIKGLVYPEIDEVDRAEVERLKDVYYYSGMIFFWHDGDREYGFFASHVNHQFCNATHVDGTSGKQVRHRRKTPEPPEKLLKRYLNCFSNKNQIDRGKLERLRTFKYKYRIPNPIPIPKPNPKHLRSKDFLGDKDKEEKRVQGIYRRAKKNKPALDDEIIKAWRAYHELYPGMGWDKLLKERGVKT